MPISNVVSTLLMLACAVGLVVGAVTLALRFVRLPGDLGGPSGPESSTMAGSDGPGGASTGSGVMLAPSERGLMPARLCALLLVVAWAAAAARMVPDTARAAAAAIALLIAGVFSGALILGPERLVQGRAPGLTGPGNMGFLVAGLAAASIGIPDPALRQWMAIGAAVGVALPAVAAGIFGLERRAWAGAALAAQAAAIGGAMVWGDRLRPQDNLGVGLALGFAGGACLVHAVAVAGVPTALGPLAPTLVGGLLGAAVALPVVALALREPTLAVPAAIGGGMAALLAGVALADGDRVPDHGGAAARGEPDGEGKGRGMEAGSDEPSPFLAMWLLVLAGGTLLLVNRLYGMVGLSLAGIGLTALTAGDSRRMRWLGALLPAIFGTRALLQVFLDRTYLRMGGVDVTQTYAFAALILGFVAGTALVRFRSLLAPDPWAGGAAALLLASSPVLVGYFIHILPLAGFIAGAIAAGFALAALGDGLEAAASRLAPYLVLVSGGAALAAPFLQEVINAPRQQRILMFLVVSALALWYAVSAVRSQLRRSAA